MSTSGAYVVWKLSELLPLTRKDSLQKYRASANDEITIHGIKTTFASLWEDELGTNFSSYYPKKVAAFDEYLKRNIVLNNEASAMKTIYKDKSNADHRASLSKKFGEVFTPEDLVEEVLEALPKDVWNDPSKKWLDPACGSGNFLVKIYNRLMKSLVVAVPNEEDRRKHILEEMIFGIELRALNCIWTSGRLDPEEKYKLNIVCHNSLKYDCKFGGKNPTGMFDVVVGNPPFQLIKEGQSASDKDRHNSKKLYIDFIDTFVKKTSVLSFIVPSAGERKVRKVTAGKIVSLINVPKERLGIDLPMCYFVYDKSASTTKVKLVLDLDVTKNLGDLWGRPQIIDRNDPRLHRGAIPTVEVTGPKDKPPVFTTTENVDTSMFPHFNLWKVITNTVGGYATIGALKIVGPGYITTASVVTFGVTTEQEAINLKGYLESALVKYFIKKLKKVTPNAKHIFEKIPLVDISRSWTDQEIYEHFKLTPEQIAEVENGIT